MKKAPGTDALTEKKDKKPAGKKDKGGKEVHMHIRPAKNGGHIVEHESRDEHGMTDGRRHEYALADTAALHDHIDEHYGDGSSPDDAGVDEAAGDQEAPESAGDVPADPAAPQASAGE